MLRQGQNNSILGIMAQFKEVWCFMSSSFPSQRTAEMLVLLVKK